MFQELKQSGQRSLLTGEDGGDATISLGSGECEFKCGQTVTVHEINLRFPNQPAGLPGASTGADTRQPHPHMPRVGRPPGGLRTRWVTPLSSHLPPSVGAIV